MSIIQRFTRDSVSKHVWATMALLASIGLVYAVIAGGEELEAERLVAQERAIASSQPLRSALGRVDVTAPLSEGEIERLQRVAVRILADEPVHRIRIWSGEERLLFSTDIRDGLGLRMLNDALLHEAAEEGKQTVTGFSDTGGAQDPERSLVRTYLAAGRRAVIEIDQTDGGTLGPVREEWFAYQAMAGGALLVFLILTGLSLRQPLERINAGVPFAASSVPRGYSLIDDDRLAAVEEVYRLGSQRVTRLKERLEESERERRGLEAKIQQTLSNASGAKPAAAAPPKHEVVEVPDSATVTPSRGECRDPAAAGPLARAKRDQRPYAAKGVEPSTRKRATRAEEPKRSKGSKVRRRPVKPAPPETPVEAAPAPMPEPRATPVPAADPVEAPGSRPAVLDGTDERAEATATAHAGSATTDALPARVDRDLEDAEAHQAALETFIRLTESDRLRRGADEIDQGAVRAALARTAARKKPGGDGLHRHDDPAERLGGPPTERR